MPRPNKKPTKRTAKTNHNGTAGLLACLKYFPKTALNYWKNGNWWRKTWLSILTVLAVIIILMYSIAQWYIIRHRNDQLKIGMTFISGYAESFGLNPKETMQAMIDDLGFRRFRLVSYWDVGEPVKGKYNFDDLDWQFNKVEAVHGKVTLALGLRQPRWPECHMPGWAKAEPEEQWSKYLKDYMGAVIDRYKNRPSLESYQLENEYFLAVFGQCSNFSRARLTDEFNFVKSKDPNHTLITTRSNNAVPSWPVGEPRADMNGASIYQRVWDGTVTKRYFEYPIPSWFYAFLAGGTELTTGRNTFIHELQTEAWPPRGIENASIAEQNKSFDASRMHSRIQYGLNTGMRTIDMWGGEWWYWRKVKMNDPSIWNAAKQELQKLDVRKAY